MNTTKRPPPPDPIDAMEAELARAREANNRLRNADDFDEPTGRFDVPIVHMHLPQPSVPDTEAVRRGGGVGAVVVALGALASAALAIMHALGLV
jgi:hypothetical protein